MFFLSISKTHKGRILIRIRIRIRSLFSHLDQVNMILDVSETKEQKKIYKVKATTK